MKKLIILLMLVPLVVLTACWDMDEIEERIFPYSIGLDLNKEAKGEKDKYTVTVVYPNIAAMGKNGGTDEKIFVVSTNSSSIFQASRGLSTTLPFPLYFNHLKVIVFGHEFARDKNSILRLIDGVNRDFVINKKVKILTAEKTAKELMEELPKAKKQDVTEGPLYSMVIGNKKTSRYTPQTMTNFLMDMDVAKVSLMPRAAIKEEDLRVFGGCIYKDFIFVGHLTEEENRAIALVRGMVNEDMMNAPFKEGSIAYSITSTKTKNKLLDREKLKILIEMETEGTLREYIYNNKPDGVTKEELKEMEEALEKAIKKEVDHVIDLLQNKYKADALCLAGYLSKFHPKVWKKLEKNWEEVFPTIEIETKIKVNIRRRGLVL